MTSLISRFTILIGQIYMAGITTALNQDQSVTRGEIKTTQVNKSLKSNIYLMFFREHLR